MEASVPPLTQGYKEEYVFVRTKSPNVETRYLYCMNCGPQAGIPYPAIHHLFSQFGPVENVLPAGDNGTRVFVVFNHVSDAITARKSLNLRHSEGLAAGKTMRIEFSDIKEKHKESYMPVMLSAEDVAIPGLTFYSNFVSLEEEEALLAAVGSRPWNELSKRRVQHYGYAFNYKQRSVDPNDRLGDLPDFTKDVVSRIEGLTELQQTEQPCLPLDQLTVNEYLRGVGLSPHVDIHSAFEGCVVSLSLGGPCIMQFRRPKFSKAMDCNGGHGLEEGEEGEYDRRAIFLPARSLLVLCGEARYAWSHYIPHHRQDIVNGKTIQRQCRVSFTFRKVRRTPCTCAYPEECDGRRAGVDSGSTLAPVSLRHLAAPEIEKKYVHKVYDAIAPHFSSTRFAKWPKVAEFLHGLPAGSLVLDAGCGNGKYLGLNPSCVFVGCDISPSLVGICASHGCEVSVADAVNLPYRSSSFDAGISIAVLHHLSSEPRRKGAMAELIRVVKPGGKIIITVWAREQEDAALLSKWTPITDAHNEKWVDTVKGRSAAANPAMGSIEESGEDEIAAAVSTMDPADDRMESMAVTGEEGSQEYFVPWHLPYHRAEISGASALAVASGLAHRDDIKGAVVYNRYYHVFTQHEIERLATEVGGTDVVGQFYDKSNWCLVLQKW